MGQGRIGNRVTAIVGLSALLGLLPDSGRAEVAIAAKAGTLGAGVELTLGVVEQLNLRAGLNGYTYAERRQASGIEYDGEAKLRTGTALLDWHPGGRGFRLTAGLVYNDTTVEGSSLPPRSGFYDIGGVPVPVDLVGTLDAKAEFDPVAPYVGLGWGNAVAAGTRIDFFVDLGLIYQGKADVTLIPIIPSGSPILTTPGALQALGVLLRREEAELEEDVNDYDLYPVLAIGLSVKL
jgi:hypothetical protein